MKKLLLLAVLSGISLHAGAEMLLNQGSQEARKSDIPVDRSRPVRIITDKEVGRMICLGGVVPETGTNVLVRGKLSQVGGKQLKVFVTRVQNTEQQDIGSVVFGSMIYRSGEVIWVERDGWEICD